MKSTTISSTLKVKKISNEYKIGHKNWGLLSCKYCTMLVLDYRAIQNNCLAISYIKRLLGNPIHQNSILWQNCHHYLHILRSLMFRIIINSMVKSNISVRANKKWEDCLRQKGVLWKHNITTSLSTLQYINWWIRVTHMNV